MNLSFFTIPYNQIVWWVVIGMGIIVAFVIIRFFWKHLLKYVFHGCLVIVVIIALLALLHFFFKIF